MTDHRLLSLWEPWATALADPDGPKTIETRGYGTTFRGPVVLLAARHRLTRAEVDELPDEVRAYYGATLDPAHGLHHGHALAVGNLVDIVPTEAIKWNEAFFSRARPEPTERSWWHEEISRGTGPGAPPPERTGTLFVHPAERPWGGYGPGRYAWLFDRIEALPEPIPAKGAQGPRSAPRELVEAVERALGR